MRITTALTAIVLTAVVASTTTVNAAMVFFASDLGVFNQDGSPTGAGFPLSSAAEASFLANLVGVGTEDFESFADGTGAPLALTFPGAGTATLGGSGEVDDDPGTGQNATSGSNWWRTGAGNDFAIDFSAPVAAFGFYGIDVGDIGAQLTLTLIDGGSVAIDIPHPIEPGGPSSPVNGSVFYFGYIDPDNPWVRAEFSNPSTGDDFGFDDMTIGSVAQVEPIPEPTSFALLGMGMLGLGVVSRRRQRAND